MQTERPHIGPDLKRNPIHPDIEWHFTRIEGDLHCKQCKARICDGLEINGKEWTFAEEVQHAINAHVCQDIKFKYDFNDPRTLKQQQTAARKERQTPKMFG